MKAKIISIATYVPSRRVHNTELPKHLDTSDEWIYSHTGVHYRHIADENEATSDLAVKAAKNALNRANMSPNDIDMILVATTSPDYPNALPATACIVQDKLEIKHTAAMDISAACSGFVHALDIARTYVESKSSKAVLVIGAEIYSRLVNWNDRRVCVLFGDGAGAAVVVPANDTTSYILPAFMRSFGDGAEYLYRSHGGTRNIFIPGKTPPEDLLLKMDGHKVYNFAVSTMIKSIQTVLKNNNVTQKDVAWVVPHQANQRIVTAAAKRAGWDIRWFYNNMEEYANTSSASIPIALAEMEEKKLLKKGQLVLLMGFGAGFTAAANLVYW